MDGSLLPISMAGINLPTLADYKLAQGLVSGAGKRCMTGCHQLVQGSFRHSYEVGPLVPGLRSLSPDTGCSECCTGLPSHTQLLEGKGTVCIHSTNTVP